MKTETTQANAGFTLIEMIGVLAIIAVLAAVLVPKVFSAINESRYGNAVATINTCKSATMSYFGKNFNFGTTNTATFDTTLVTGGFLEHLLTTKLGTTNILQTTTLALCNGGTPYKLDGVNGITGATVVEIVMTNVAAADAWELSKRIDGLGMSGATSAVASTKGSVEYALPGGTSVTTVYVYLADK